MKEIEVKILDVNVPSLRKKLHALGAKKFFDGEIESVSLDYADERLEKEGKMLRVRKAGDRCEITFKGKNVSSQFKKMDEIEVVTNDFDMTLEIFKRIGMKEIYRGTKKRECYRRGNIKFDIDAVRGIPPYVEVEASTEKDVVAGVRLLGFTMKQTTNMNGFQVLDYYIKKKKTRGKST